MSSTRIRGNKTSILNENILTISSTSSSSSTATIPVPVTSSVATTTATATAATAAVASVGSGGGTLGIDINHIDGNNNDNANLLKIESVVPKLNRLNNNNKLIFRSNSTLNSSYLRNVNHDIPINIKGMSNTFSKSNNNVTNANLPSEDNNIVITTQNGITRIKRTPNDREKHPDRINLDRRGLTFVPYIDDEPNIRLLSLQHNLINTFHIPEESIPNSINLNATEPMNNKHNNNNIDDVSHKVNNNKQNNMNMTTNHNMNTHYTNKLLTKPFLKQKSISRSQLLINNKLNKHNLILQNKQPPLLTLNIQNKNILKKSNSFISNTSCYYPSQPTMTTTSNSHFLNKGNNRYHNKLHHTPSFSLDNLMNFNNNNYNNDLISTPQSQVVPSSSFKISTTTSTTTTASSSSSTAITNLDSHDIKLDINIKYSEKMKYNFKSIVFLDLYDNQIEKISNLDGLKCLTVLLLGKNRITDITGLISLKNTLRVLDLHGNKISNIANKISQLHELKSLNLAGNLLRQINANDFNNLYNLKELNLKRNRLKKILGFIDLRNLERLWLCHNDLQKIDDMQSIAKAVNLKEISIENNPVSLAGDCVAFLVSYLPNLVVLSQMNITEQVRRAASAWRKNKEISDTNFSTLSTDVCNNIRREEIISNARTNWELLRSQQTTIATAVNVSNHQGIKQNSSINKDIQKFSSNQVKVRDLDVEILSNLSDNMLNNKKNSNMIRAQKNVIGNSNNVGNGSNNHNYINGTNNTNSNKKNINKKMIRSSSQDGSGNNNSGSLHGSDQSSEDYFRLPPILQPFIETTNTSKNSSGSSLGPNVDSCSSLCSSDNELSVEPSKSSEIPMATLKSDEEIKEIKTNLEDVQTLNTATDILKKTTDGKTPITSPPIGTNKNEVLLKTINLVNENFSGSSEKLLNLNIKANNLESVTAASSPDDPRLISSNNINIYSSNSQCVQNPPTITTTNITVPQQATAVVPTPITTSILPTPSHQKCRSAVPNKRYGSGSLVRAQTARNMCTGSAQNLLNVNNIISNQQKLGQQVQQQQQQPNQQVTQTKTVEREREQGGDYLIEICGRYLNVYGLGALKFIDKQWNQQKANDVHTIKFSYINFNSISTILCRIKTRFQNADNFIFRDTNITCLGQLNALAESQGINSLSIEPEGNFITTKSWRKYAIYRLSHWGLKQINTVDITEDEIQDAEQMYSGLSDLVLWSLPEQLLQPLLIRLRLDETCLASKMTAKEWLMQADPSLKNVVGKEALQWKKTSGTLNDDLQIRQKGRLYFAQMMENTCNAVEKLQKLELMWPTILFEMIRNTLIDYSQIDIYVKSLLNEIMK